MSRNEDKNLPSHISFPRVSGDEPASSDNLKGTLKFSPRERG